MLGSELEGCFMEENSADQRKIDALVEKMTASPEVLNYKGSKLLRPSPTPKGKTESVSRGK